MKKLILVILLLLAITGCAEQNEDFSCSFTNKVDDKEYTTKVDIDVEDDEVVDATAYMTFNDDELAQTMCNLLGATSDSEGNLECNGRSITIKNYHKSLSSETFTKEELKEYLEKQNYSCNSN